MERRLWRSSYLFFRIR